MKKKVSILFTLVLFLIAVSGCTSTKGYVGDNLPEAELAVITGGKNEVTVEGKKQVEQIGIIYVDSLEVGNYKKGYPEYVHVTEGRKTIEVRHLKPWEIKNTSYLAYGCLVFGALGGAIGGSIKANTEEKNNPHTNYRLVFDVKKGERYIIMAKTDEARPDTAMLTITRQRDGVIVPFDVTRIDINKSVAQNK